MSARLHGEHLEILARAVEQVADAVEICDPSYRLQYVNRAFEQLTGYAYEEVMGKTPEELLRADDQPAAFYRELEGTLQQRRAWRGRVRSRTKEGKRLVCDVAVTPIVDDAGSITHFVCVRRDVTERDLLQTQLMQSDRLAAVGHLAAGMAHEINNPLAYVLANTTFLRETFEELVASLDAGIADEARAALADIEHGALRIRDIVKDLGAFARPSEDSAGAGAIDVRAVMDSSANLLVNELKHRARLVRRYGEVPMVWGQRTRLGQVFLNLVMNAAHAIPVGAASDNEIVIVTRTDADGNARIEIRDTGEGIPADVLPEIFDPFFTTRPVGQGTGLGLAVSHTIVESMGGRVTVETEVGRGTTFVVTLPPAGPVVEDEAAAFEAAESSGASVLVIDDEPGVLRAVERMLRGYRVELCASGREAMDLLRERSFDVIFCDLMMPELSGMELYGRAVQERPDLASRFVFITGGAYTPDAQRFLLSRNNAVLEKPFAPARLRGMIELMVRR